MRTTFSATLPRSAWASPRRPCVAMTMRSACVSAAAVVISLHAGPWRSIPCGADVSPRLEVLKTTEPPGRKAGVKVKTVGELVDKLKNELGLI